MSPQQEVFTMLRNAAVGVVGAESTYDFLPGNDCVYPFVFIGEQFGEDQPNKTAIFGTVSTTIHVYHNDFEKRGDVTKIMENLIQAIRGKRYAGEYAVSILGVSYQVNQEIVQTQEFLHGILEIKIHFSHTGKKGA